MAPASVLHPNVKLWRFRGWGLDFVGEIHPSSMKGHRFVLVATDYFTKWVETVSLRNMTHREVINFVTEHIIHRFGVPQTLTTNQGPAFMSQQFKEFTMSLGIQLLNSSPYYAQANGQAKASNKALVGIIKKRIDEKSRRWHEVMSKAMWAYRTLKHRAVKVTPFELVYGQEVVLPVEIRLQVDRVAKQNSLAANDSREMMLDRVDDMDEQRLLALRNIEEDKVKVAKTYNKRVRKKSFQVGDLVWKMILPLGT
jgi:hypothetical protein